MGQNPKISLFGTSVSPLPSPRHSGVEDAVFDFDYYWLVFKMLTTIQFPRPISGRFLLAFLRADLLYCSHKRAMCTHRQRCLSPPTAPGGMHIKPKKDLNRNHR